MNGRLTAYLAALAVAALAPGVQAAPPPDIPGEEITDEYLDRLLPPDTVQALTPKTSIQSEDWLDEAQKSWLAPTLAEQIGEDETFMPMGKGAVFLPRMSESALEPDIEILSDETGEPVAHGKPGRSFALLPGSYSVIFGSGSHQQQIVRRVDVVEGKLNTVVPDWAGLAVDVVDENNFPWSGDYEMVRIDEFEPFGRGRGADPDLGEQAPVWILKPGIYKIFSVGESYNTLSNFITVRLLAGQFTRVVLVVDEDDLKITGGGIVEVNLEQMRERAWSYGLDFGGSVLFNGQIDRLQEDDRGKNSSTIAVLLYGWLRYNKDPWDWSSSLRLDEGFTITDFEFSRIETTKDDARLRTLGIWRLLSWLGPYGRGEVQTSMFPEFERLDEEDFFVVVSEGQNSFRVDSSVASLEAESGFSPFTIEAGIGANMDIVNTRVFEAKFRVGFGYTFNRVSDKLDPLSEQEITDSTLAAAYATTLRNGFLLTDLPGASTHEAGPEAALSLGLRLGGWALVRSEARWFAPVAPEWRFSRPDVAIESTISWRIARAVTLDYEFEYTLKQPEEENLRQDLVEHGVTLRFSIRTR